MKEILKGIVVGILLILLISGGMAINNWYNDTFTSTTGQIVTEEEVNEEDNPGVGISTTIEARVKRAETYLETLPTDQELPENFDWQLIQAFEEENAYVKVFNTNYRYDNLNKNAQGPAILFKMYLDENLTEPIYIFESGIRHSPAFGWTPHNPETFELGTCVYSMDGQTWASFNQKLYETQKFYYKNTLGETLQLRFSGVSRLILSYTYRPSSFFNNDRIKNYWDSFVNSGKSNVDVNFYIQDFFIVSTKQDNKWTLSTENILFKFNFYNVYNQIKIRHFTSGDDPVKEYISLEEFYKLYPLPTPTSEIALLNDNMSMYVKDYKIWTTYKFDGVTLQNKYDLYTASKYGVEEETKILTSKIQSEYFTTQEQIINKDIFTVDLTKFATELTDTGIRVLALPISFPLVNSVYYSETSTFILADLIQYNITVNQYAEETMLDSAITGAMNFIPDEDNFDFTNDNFQVIFEEGLFTLLEGTTRVEIVITIQNGSQLGDTYTSLIEV